MKRLISIFKQYVLKYSILHVIYFFENSPSNVQLFLNAFSIKSKRRQVGFKWKKVNTYILFFKSDPMGGRVCECTDKDMEIPRKTASKLTNSLDW